MKRYIRSNNAEIDLESEILAEFGGFKPNPGCIFVSKDGTFVNIYPKLDTHEDLCEWVEDNLNIEIKYPDEEYFINLFNWIRLRFDPSMTIIELPANNPTGAQWASLEEWLLYVEDAIANREITLYLTVYNDPQNCDVEYRFGKNYFAEDIIKLLKRYYSSGRLYASIFTHKLHRRIIK